MWQVIHEFITSKKTFNTPSSIYCYSNLINTPQTISEAFNQDFTEIGERLSAKIDTKKFFLSFLTNRNPKSMILLSLINAEIYNTIHSLKNKTSAGVDNIPSFFLKKGCCSNGALSKATG